VYERITANRWRTFALFLASVALLVGLGWVFGQLFQSGIGGIVIALILAAVLSITSYRFGDKLVLAAARAKRVTRDEEPRLHNLVEGLCIAAGMNTVPAIYVVPEDAPNAFATGRDPKHASIAVTRGLLERLNRVELEGVLAHELSHVTNRDILVGTIAATLAGAVVLLAEIFLRSLWWGGGRRRGNRDGGGSAFLIFVVLGIVLALLAPLFAQLIRLAISRRREYLADATGAMLTRYPPGLASALKKIAADTTPMRVTNNATAHLWLSPPSRTPGTATPLWERLFSTHPPIAERIQLLEEM
jgi:heat shock protein HtpX